MTDRESTEPIQLTTQQPVTKELIDKEIDRFQQFCNQKYQFEDLAKFERAIIDLYIRYKVGALK